MEDLEADPSPLTKTSESHRNRRRPTITQSVQCSSLLSNPCELSKTHHLPHPQTAGHLLDPICEPAGHLMDPLCSNCRHSPSACSSVRMSISRNNSATFSLVQQPASSPSEYDSGCEMSHAQ